jgi:hypothetical protein
MEHSARVHLINPCVRAPANAYTTPKNPHPNNTRVMIRYVFLPLIEDGPVNLISRLRAKRLEFFSRDIRPVGGGGPRGFVGGLWYELGELQFKYLVEQGLRPGHVLLDIACGSLRAGVRFVPYLDPGNYLGIDIDGGLIEHGRTVELGQILCNVKHPEFIVSPSFEFSRFSKQPDFAIAQSLFTHLTTPDIALCLQNLRSIAKASTVLYATFFEVASEVSNPGESHPHAAFRFTREQMGWLGEQAGWKMEYIGGWGHPRDQKMLRYVVAG